MFMFEFWLDCGEGGAKKEGWCLRRDLISTPSQDQLPGLNVYLSVFQAGDVANYGSNSRGYREELSELGSQSSDQERGKRENAPNILRGNSGVVKGLAFSAGMSLYLAFGDLETSFPPPS